MMGATTFYLLEQERLQKAKQEEVKQVEEKKQSKARGQKRQTSQKKQEK